MQGHPLECDWPPRGHTLKESWLTVSQKPSFVNSSSGRGGGSWAPLPCILAYLIWAPTGSGRSWVQVSCHVQKDLLHSGPPWPLALTVSYAPSAMFSCTGRGWYGCPVCGWARTGLILCTWPSVSSCINYHLLHKETSLVKSSANVWV